MLTMSKGTPITKLTSSSCFPIFTHFSLQFSWIILYKSLLFLLSLESLLLWLNIYLEIVWGIRPIEGHTWRGSISVFLLINLTTFWGIGLSRQTVRLLLASWDVKSVILDSNLKVVIVIMTTTLGSNGSRSYKSIR